MYSTKAIVKWSLSTVMFLTEVLTPILETRRIEFNKNTGPLECRRMLCFTTIRRRLHFAIAADVITFTSVLVSKSIARTSDAALLQFSKLTVVQKFYIIARKPGRKYKVETLLKIRLGY